ncbi:hypothetical protein GXW82_33210 [Streptacidiphilus sp. 4-A2]|nr:hypothetical protein [Streptacidiphilus sp. 4-A2]
MLRRAQHLIDASGLLPAIEPVLHAATGTPRLFPARALLTGLALHALRQEEMHLTKVASSLAQLSPSARRDLGLSDLGDEGVTYRMVWHAYDRLTAAMEAGTLTIPHNHPAPYLDRWTGEILCPADCPQEVLTPDTFQQRLLAASAPASVALSPRSRSTPPTTRPGPAALLVQHPRRRPRPPTPGTHQEDHRQKRKNQQRRQTRPPPGQRTRLAAHRTRRPCPEHPGPRRP